MNRYRTRLERQARRAPVAVINGIPSLIAQGKNDCEEDNEFIRWVHRARHLSSMMALRASTNAADVRLEQRTAITVYVHVDEPISNKVRTSSAESTRRCH